MPAQAQLSANSSQQGDVPDASEQTGHAALAAHISEAAPCPAEAGDTCRHLSLPPDRMQQAFQVTITTQALLYATTIVDTHNTGQRLMLPSRPMGKGCRCSRFFVEADSLVGQNSNNQAPSWVLTHGDCAVNTWV